MKTKQKKSERAASTSVSWVLAVYSDLRVPRPSSDSSKNFAKGPRTSFSRSVSLNSLNTSLNLSNLSFATITPDSSTPQFPSFHRVELTISRYEEMSRRASARATRRGAEDAARIGRRALRSCPCRLSRSLTFLLHSESRLVLVGLLGDGSFEDGLPRVGGRASSSRASASKRSPTTEEKETRALRGRWERREDD